MICNIVRIHINMQKFQGKKKNSYNSIAVAVGFFFLFCPDKDKVSINSWCPQYKKSINSWWESVSCHLIDHRCLNAVFVASSTFCFEYNSSIFDQVEITFSPNCS